MAEPLLHHLPAVRARLLARPHWHLFLDFDGTLASLAPRPDTAHLPDGVGALLGCLAAHSRITLAVVSGRSLSDLAKEVAVPGIILVGNHGLEMTGPGVAFVHAGAEGWRAVLATAAGLLRAELARFPGVLIEEKRLSLSVHYRLAPAHAEEVGAAVGRAVASQGPGSGEPSSGGCSRVARAQAGGPAPQAAGAGLLVRRGHMVLELLPPVEWDKGAAVRWLLGQAHGTGWPGSCAPVCAGDDQTDETMFAALKGIGAVTLVKIGPGPTEAAYQLDGPEEVLVFLEHLLRWA
ncbi:MAG: trehalose-phosphatase [Deltaproteobacteria bacterium]|nr:trehalose-phosphatase [Deltaproteobacteria bacterium]